MAASQVSTRVAALVPGAKPWGPLLAAQGINTANPQHRASTSWGRGNQRLAEG